MTERWRTANAKDMKLAMTMWPHGQVVKTAASHAVNVGSNPAGVTKQKKLDKRWKMIYNICR